MTTPPWCREKVLVYYRNHVQRDSRISDSCENSFLMLLYRVPRLNELHGGLQGKQINKVHYNSAKNIWTSYIKQMHDI